MMYSDQAIGPVSVLFYGDESAAVGKVNITSRPVSSDTDVFLQLKLAFNSFTVTAISLVIEHMLKALGNRETNSLSVKISAHFFGPWRFVCVNVLYTF